MNFWVFLKIRLVSNYEEPMMGLILKNMQILQYQSTTAWHLERETTEQIYSVPKDSTIFWSHQSLWIFRPILSLFCNRKFGSFLVILDPLLLTSNFCSIQIHTVVQSCRWTMNKNSPVTRVSVSLAHDWENSHSLKQKAIALERLQLHSYWNFSISHFFCLQYRKNWI